MNGIGSEMKQIIDAARVVDLIKSGFADAALKTYCSKEVMLENVIVTASTCSLKMYFAIKKIQGNQNEAEKSHCLSFVFTLNRSFGAFDLSSAKVQMLWHKRSS